MQHTGNVSNPTGIETHLYNLLLDLSFAAWVIQVEAEGLIRTLWVEAAITSFAIGGGSMLFHICSLAVGTMNG